MTLDGHIGLTLFRDGRRPAVSGGRFGPSEAMRNPSGVEQSVVLDRLDGGVGAVERMVPNTYPLTIDGCTRFARVWTPGGEITYLPPLAPISGRAPGQIRAMLTWGESLIIAAGGNIYSLSDPYTLAVPMGQVGLDEEVQDLIEFEGVLVAGTRQLSDGLPGSLWAFNGSFWDVNTAKGQHLCKSYQVINDLGAWRLTTNDTPWTFRFIATGSTAITLTNILDDSAWAGTGGLYPVGERSARITNMAGAPLIMFFAKEDGIYHVGPDGRAARIMDWSDSVHRRNGEVLYFAYGGLYASHVRWGLVRVDVANLQVQWQTNACAPGANLPRVVPAHGQITAFTMDGEWMVVPVFNGLDSYLFYGRPNEITERTAMINLQSPQSLNWHGSEATFWNERVTCLEQATIGPVDRPLLWVGAVRTDPETGTGSVVLANVSLPKLGSPLEDWLMGGPHRFATQSWLYYPRQDWGDERGGVYSGWAPVRKVFTRLDLTGEYLERYVTWIDAFMAAEGGHQLFWDRALDPESTLWSNVGRFDEGSRVSLVPGKTVQSGVKAHLLLRGYGQRDKPFALYGAKLRGTPLLEQSERRQYRVVLGRFKKANQALDHQERLTTLNELWALQWSDPVVLIDHLGMALVIDIAPDMSYEDVIEPNTQEPTTVVTFSFRVIRRPFVWGSGFRWGGDISWS